MRVPEGWRSVRLGDVARESRLRNDGSAIDAERLYGVFKDEGMVPMRDRVRGASVERCKVVRPGAFAYNPMRLNIGSIACWTGSDNAIVSPDYVVFECDPRQIDYRYLNHLRKGCGWAKFTERSGDGGVRVRIYFDHLAEFKFPLPSLPEQRSIVEVLSSVDEAITTTREVMDQTRSTQQSVLKRLLTKGIGHSNFRQTEIGAIPVEWKVCSIGSILKMTSGKIKPIKKLKGEGIETPYPVYGGNGIAGYDGEYLIDDDVIIMGRVGENCGVVHRASGKIWVTDNALYSAWVSSDMNKDFLAAALAALPLDEIRGGGGQPLISQKPLYKQVLCVPPLEEQEAISTVNATFNYQYLRLAKELSHQAKVKSALMADLLTGRKRVSADALSPAL